jgi:pimeloyl-ACP methyl ester carboxylesterase
MMLRRTCLLSLTFAMSALVCAQTPLEDRFFDSNGARIRYVDVGRGEPVLLVHAFSESVESWQRAGVIDALARDFRVVAFDSRGHGKSDKSRDTARYGLEMVEDIARLLDHLQIRSAHIVSYSMGGFITGKFVAIHPDRVRTATFGGSSPMSPKLWATQFESLIPELADDLEQGRGLRSVLLRWAARSGQPAPSEDQLDQTSRTLLADDDPLALAAAVRGFRETMLLTSQEIRSFSLPMLLVVGTADGPRERVDAFEGTEPKVVFIDGATHGGPSGALRRPEFAAAVRDFLTTHTAVPSRPDR